MKRVKRIASILLAVVMVLGMSMTVFADETPETSTTHEVKAGEGTGSITIQASQSATGSVGVTGKSFKIYKILDAEFASSTNVDGSRGIVYKVPKELKSFYAERFAETDVANYVDKSLGDPYKPGFDEAVVAQISTYSSNSAALELFAKDVLDACTDALCMATVESVPDGKTSVKVSGLPLGYYLIKDTTVSQDNANDPNGTVGETPVSALVLDTTKPDVTVYVKAEVPQITKQIAIPTTNCGEERHVHGIDCDDETNCNATAHVHSAACYGNDVTYATSNTAAIGEPVKYRVTSAVPNMAGYQNYFFVVTDTMAPGLKLIDTDNNGFQVKIGDSVKTRGTDYTVEVTYKDSEGESADTDGDGLNAATIKIVFKDFIQYKELVGTPITIDYSAEVTRYVEATPTGNANEVSLKYPVNHEEDSWWDPETEEPKPNVPIGETPKQRVYTYVAGLELLKTDDSKPANLLAGAVFKIEGMASNKTLVNTEQFTLDENGSYYKLKNDTYTLEAPIKEGENANIDYYVQPLERYKKELVRSDVEEFESYSYEGTVGATGSLNISGLKAGDYTITEIKAPQGYNILTEPIHIRVTCTPPETPGDAATWEVVGAGAEVKGSIIQLTVENRSGSLLPSTGGIGTTIFYVAGAILVIGAGILLVVKKRMSNR